MKGSLARAIPACWKARLHGARGPILGAAKQDDNAVSSCAQELLLAPPPGCSSPAPVFSNSRAVRATAATRHPIKSELAACTLRRSLQG